MAITRIEPYIVNSSANFDFAGVNVTANFNVTGQSNLGPVGNIIITGGSNGQVLSTNGSGSLSWISISSSSISNGNSNVSVPAADGNVVISVAGNANIITVTGTGANVAGTFNITGDLQAANANLGNLATANFLSGTLTTAAQPNITSVGALGSLAVTGITNLGAVANVIITGGSNGQVLTTNGSGNLSWTSITTTTVSNGNSNVNIPVANGNINMSVAGNANVLVVTGTGANVAGTLDITGNFTVGGKSNLGSVSNVIITGGSANYILKTDGAGNLSWAQPDPLAAYVDTFTGNGVQTQFTLSVTPSNVNLTTVSYNGSFLVRDSYSLSGANIVFTEAPANGSQIQVTTLSGGGGAAVGGSDTHIQFNDGGSFSGNSGLTFNKSNTTLTANNLYVPGTVRGNLIPDANITYDLGTSSMRWRDLWLSGTTIHIGEAQITTANSTVVLPEGTKVGNVPVSVDLANMNDVNANIAPEVFTINVDFPNAGHGDDWLWTWDAGTVAYSRSKVTNAVQATVPLYRSGTYVVNNFAAHDLHGNMTQTHKIYLKWVNGAGLDNLVSWAPSTLNVANVSHPDINGGANTTVQRLNINVPQTITIPPLNPPNVSYNVTVANMQWVFTGTAVGHNPNIGPVYRGGTYTFNLSNTAGHPFYLTTDNGDNFAGGQYVGEYTNGVTGSRNTSGNLTITIPNNAPNTLYYQCGNHGSMRGQIDVRNLEVETNASGNLILYFQHTQEGHFTPAEIRPTPNLQTISSACLIFNGATGMFEIKDMGQYLDETAQFQSKIENIVATETADKPTNAEVVQKIKEETVFTTTMYQRGNLELTTGTMRWFAPYDLQITNITPRLGTAADANVSVMIKKNGANAQGFTFAASTTLANVANGNISMNTGDFLTVDVTNVGNALPGQDLYVQFTYRKV